MGSVPGFLVPCSGISYQKTRTAITYRSIPEGDLFDFIRMRSPRRMRRKGDRATELLHFFASALSLLPASELACYNAAGFGRGLIGRGLK